MSRNSGSQGSPVLSCPPAAGHPVACVFIFAVWRHPVSITRNYSTAAGAPREAQEACRATKSPQPQAPRLTHPQACQNRRGRPGQGVFRARAQNLQGRRSLGAANPVPVRLLVTRLLCDFSTSHLWACFSICKVKGQTKESFQILNWKSWAHLSPSSHNCSHSSSTSSVRE